MITPMALVMTRGDGAQLGITLADGATFAADEQVRFTAKRRLGDTDDEAVIAKSSGAGEITFGAGESTATVFLAAADTDGLSESVLLHYDIQATPAGGEPETLTHGLLLVRADVTRTAP